MGAWHPESPARLQAIEDQLIASRIDSFLDYREAPVAAPQVTACVSVGGRRGYVRGGVCVGN